MKETARYFIGSSTREALLALRLDSRRQDLLEKGVTGLETALGTQDPVGLVESLDDLARVALERRDRAETVVPSAQLLRDVLDALSSTDAMASSPAARGTARAMRSALMEWWYETWLVLEGREQMRAYLASPQHVPLTESPVREHAREQVTAYPVQAKEKLLRALEVDRAETGDEAEELRRQGRRAEADLREHRQVAYGWAISEIEVSITMG